MEFDWFTLLLIFVFFVLPMLQQLFRKKPPPPSELPPEEDDWEWELPPGREREGQVSREAQARRTEGESWSEEWEEWPEEAAPEPARERSAWEDLGLEDIFRETRPAPRAPQPREPEPVTAAPAPAPPPPLPTISLPTPRPSAPPPRVVSLESLEVDRDAKYARFHESALRSPVATVRRDPRTLLATQMHDPQELRRAIILNEVLGPPRALRPLEPNLPQ